METFKETREKFIIAALVLTLILLFTSVIFSVEQKMSIADAFFYIIFSLETFNYKGDYGILLLFISFFIGVFAVYLFETLIYLVRDEFGGVVYMAQTLRLKDHYIVCGGGRIGQHVANLLEEKHKKVIIIEKDENVALELKNMGFKVLKENALEEKTFKMVNTSRAKAVFACLGQDVDNFIVILNAKAANKNIVVISRCNSVKNIGKFKNLGADEVVLPEIAGADRMVYLEERFKPK